MFRHWSLLVLLLLSALSLRAESEDLKQLSKHPRWIRLGHYHQRWILSGVKSFADSPKFFFSEEGKKDPYKELLATIEAFKNPDPGKKFKWHPQCAFPARLKFLKQNTSIQFPQVQCKDFDWWYKRIAAKGVSLVFSSYYASNPASMFGHTLLKLNTEEDGPGKLSDFSVNFAANTGPEKGLLYIIKGLFGGYYGLFSTEPYYNRVNDYVNGESRDLWEYQLKMDQDAVDWVVKHIWELKTNSYFDYYFFDENCSYVVLKVLEVGNLNWQLGHGFYFYALPVGTIKRLQENKAIKRVTFRPSFRKKMYFRQESLSPEQNKIFQQLKTKSLELKDVKDPQVLEAFAAFLRFKRYEDGDIKEVVDQFKKEIRKTLIARAKLGGKTNVDESIIEKRNLYDNPLGSHHSFTLESSFGYHSQRKAFEQIHWRFGIHGIFNSGLGLPPFSNLEFVAAKLRYYNDSQKFRLQEFTAIDMVSHPDYDLLTKNFSWGVSIKALIPQDYANDNSLVEQIRPTFGYAKNFFNGQFNLFAMSIADIQYGPSLQKDNFRIAPALKLGFHSEWSQKFRFHSWIISLYDWRESFNKKLRHEITSGMSYSWSQSFETIIRHDFFTSSQIGHKDQEETKLELSYFF